METTVYSVDGFTDYLVAACLAFIIIISTVRLSMMKDTNHIALAIVLGSIASLSYVFLGA